MTSSKITTDLAVDDALDMGAGYSFTAADRRYIDNQVRGCQRHLVDSLLSGAVVAWMMLDAGGSGGDAGDVVCLASNASVRSIVKATAANLATGKGAMGVQLESGAAGAKVRVAVGGSVQPSITGLASGAAGYARINTTTGKVERVASYSPGDYPLGPIDDAGNLALVPGTPTVAVNTTGSISTDTTNFDGILSATEDTVQKALDVIDDIEDLALAFTNDVSVVGAGGNLIETDVSENKMGLYGVTPVVQPTYSYTSGTIDSDLADVLDKLHESGVIAVTVLPAA